MGGVDLGRTRGGGGGRSDGGEMREAAPHNEFWNSWMS